MSRDALFAGEKVYFLSTVHGEAPTPQPVRAMDRWRLAWRGRRDARRALPGAPTAQPFLEALRAQAEAGQQVASVWLRDMILPIDVEAVQLLTLLEQYRRDPPIPPERTAARSATGDADPQPAPRVASWVREAREAAAAQHEFTRRMSERNAAEQRLAQLGSIRHHFIEIARAAAHAHAARYEYLVAHYQAALLRRQPNERQSSMPPAVRTEQWLHGDVPLLALDVDRDRVESWYLKEFEARTSAPDRPVLDDVAKE